MKGEEVVRAAASRGLFLPVQSLSPRLGPGEEASKHKKGAWTHGRLSPQGLGPRRLGSRAFSGWGGGGVGWRASAWERQRAAGSSQRLQERCLERLSAGRPSWALGLHCGTKRGRCGCMGRESNPGLPRGRREFYH